MANKKKKTKEVYFGYCSRKKSKGRGVPPGSCGQVFVF